MEIRKVQDDIDYANVVCFFSERVKGNILFFLNYYCSSQKLEVG